MTQMNVRQAKVAEPVLTTHARGYRQAAFVGSLLFPLAPVGTYSGLTIEFGKESFRVYSSKRAPGTAVKRVRVGYAGKPYSIVPSSLAGVVPDEIDNDARAVPGINLGTRAVNTVMRSLLLEHEVACANLARATGSYESTHRITLTGSARWTSDTSTPLDDVALGRDRVRGSIGIDPNTLVLGPSCMRALKNHPDIVARTGTNGTRIVTAEVLQDLFEVDRVVVGKAVAATGNDDAAVLSDVWGNDAVLAYVSPGSDVNANIEEPSFGYTYLIDGHPVVLEPRRDDDAHSWIYEVSFDNTPLIAGMSAGYLLKDAGAAAA